MPSIATSPSHSRAATQQHLPATPKSRQQHQQQQQRRPQRKTQSMSPQSAAAFASSSICSSPSARNVPLPPIEWLNQLQVPGTCESLPSRPSSSNSNSSTPSSPCPSVSSTDSALSLAAKHSDHRQMAGVRVCPLQLIAAVASA